MKNWSEIQGCAVKCQTHTKYDQSLPVSTRKHTHSNPFGCTTLENSHSLAHTLERRSRHKSYCIDASECARVKSTSNNEKTFFFFFFLSFSFSRCSAVICVMDIVHHRCLLRQLRSLHHHKWLKWMRSNAMLMDKHITVSELARIGTTFCVAVARHNNWRMGRVSVDLSCYYRRHCCCAWWPEKVKAQVV